LSGAPFPPPTHKKIYKRNLDPWGFAGFELKCAVTRIYGDLLSLKIEDYIKNGKCNGTLYKESKVLNPGDCIISFNYDLLVEKLLDNIQQKVIRAYPYLTADTNNGILLCKPHGSLNWKVQYPENGKSVDILTCALKENEIDFDPTKNIEIQPGIIAPVPFKSEILFPET